LFGLFNEAVEMLRQAQQDKQYFQRIDLQPVANTVVVMNLKMMCY